MSNTSNKPKQSTFRERAKSLRPRDPWFGATYEEAPIRALRDAQLLTGDEKLDWLEEMYKLFNTEPPPKPGSVPLPPRIKKEEE